ncbi:hypothetical protein CBR_g38586 [Chara braunii]|uniref:Reverse transcriptase domain-containing protein n=1 Tax=Chara braunii TaxID=69332 RepID=A0A388K0E9_CHABU|nr:hypothetical protein CBR_g38586 [Chara braunii]|eukprot:GBG63518.1 hypothetical protein CBR_g38586 [Chara braunii]
MSGGGGAIPRKTLTLDDLIEALDKCERAPSNVPKVDTFHFKGERVSDWLDLVEQALVGLADEVIFQRIMRYVLHSHHQEVSKVVDAAEDSWERFKEGMLRKHRLGDGLLTMADLEAMNKDDFSTIGAFVHEFKKKARKVHGISEEAQCAIFLGLLTGTEASELTSHGGGSEKLTWATIDKGVEEGSLDQVEQHQMRLQRQKRKERDATASGTPGVKRIVTEVLAALGYDNGAEVQKKGVTVTQCRISWAADEEVGREDYGGEETGSQYLQRLNAVTVRDAGGLPNTDALSESCAGRPIISLIDLYSGYDQFPVYPPDRPVTAMHTPRGLIHMNVAPQGWTNAVAMVQRHMIRAMQTVSPHITQPYIDDLAVKGPKKREEDEVMSGVRRFVLKHVQDLAQVLSLLEEYNLTASGPKSKHCMREATILGFVCNENGRRPNVKKTDKIVEWPVPFRSITEVRSFLDTCGFWRSFVKNFAAKTEHLRKLVRQDQEWVWGGDQESAVKQMKAEFKEGGLVLGTPNYEVTEEKPFIIETDSGPTALGGVLIQADAEGKERPLRFESRTLNTTERNYSQFKKETLAVLHCLRIFRNYVFGRRFVLRVDPTALACSLKNYTPSDPTVARWLTYFWMFNFELERIPGDKNRADGLSRINWDESDQKSIEDTPPVDGFLDQEEDVRLHINECPCGLAEEVRTIEEGPTQVEEHEQLMGGMYLLTNTLLQGDFDRKNSFSPMEREDVIPESRDDEFEEGEIKEVFRAEEYDGIYLELGLLLSCEMRDRDASAKAKKMKHLYVVRDGHLFIKRQVGNPKRIVCGRNWQIDIIASLHDGIAGGHRGIGATCAKISELYHWDGMLTMVIKYCQSCVPCQERSAQRPREPLHPRLEKEVRAVVHLDLLFMLAGENGCNYIFDARDNLTAV